MTVTFTVDECWLGRWRGPSTIAVDAPGDSAGDVAGDQADIGAAAGDAELSGFRIADDSDPAPTGHLPGTVLTGFCDTHVHLGLIDRGALVSGGITAVVDLGGELDLLSEWATKARMPELSFAGQILTTPGGYPSQSSWAPRAAWREVSAPIEAKSAVSAQLAAGATVIKLALNSDAGPVLDTPTLSALVAHSHARGIRVVAHVQGRGEAERAWDAGVNSFAHTPWSERLDDRLIGAMARTQTWISTLDIHGRGDAGTDPDSAHDRSVAEDNLRRFHAAGGRVHYGTDLGNGELPVGINPRELQALSAVGLGTDALVAAVATSRFGARLSYLPEPNSGDGAQWLAGAIALEPSSLVDLLK